MNGHLHLSVNLNKPQEIERAIEILRNFQPLITKGDDFYKDKDVHIDKDTGAITVTPKLTGEEIEDAKDEVKKAIQLHKRDYHGRFVKKDKKK